jgi:hypothetical protein
LEDFYSNYLSSLTERKSSRFTQSFVPMGENIFYGKILNSDFCDHTVALVKEHISNKNNFPNLTNSMHSSAVSTHELGIKDFVNSFAKTILKEVVNSLFLNSSRISFDSIHSYIVRYGAEYDRELGFHVDDSLVTMNLCLNNGFSGSDLIFKGTRCPIHVDTESTDDKETYIKHKKGFMVLHGGKNRHYVTPIEAGERYNLIVWCQNNDERDQWFEALNNNQCLEYCDIHR